MNRKRIQYDRNLVGERIKRQRIELGMSQQELGEKIDRAVKYCSDIECGKCGMSIENLIAIANTLEVSVDYILFGNK